MSEIHFKVKQDDGCSSLKEIEAGVPQESVLGLVIYLLYIYNLPNLENNITATFADDTVITTVGPC